MKPIIQSIAGVLLAMMFVACGGRQQVHPDCLEDYDACINACAYQCEESQAALGPQYTDDYETLNNWDYECQRCTDQCRDVAERCGERARDEAFGD